MARFTLALCVLGAALGVHGTSVSPVQKVIELLESCKAKVQKDLAAEAKAMEEYTEFCDKELTEKGYAIKTATKELAELGADVTDAQATISEMEDVIAETGAKVAEKDKELAAAGSERDAKKAEFEGAEKEMLESVDELTRAADTLKQATGGAFLQASALPNKVRSAIAALTTIVEAGRLDVASKKKLSAFLQEAQGDKEDLDLMGALKAHQPSTGGILETVEGMQKKAETSLSELRKKETEENHGFEMVKQNLESEIGNAKEKLDMSTKSKADATQKLADAEATTVETKKSKAADEDYSASLKTQCEESARMWTERQKSAAEEMAAIDKAKEILATGVKAFVQVKSSLRRSAWGDDDDSVSAESQARAKATKILRALAKKHRSFALAQIASASAADPFGKVRAMVEDMIAKLVKEAQEEATHEAFCNEEMGKSKASQAEKTAALEKHTNRIEEAEATIAQTEKKIKTLEAEIAEIDKAQAEATKVRTEENEEYKKDSEDFRQSAEAVARAIEVLKGFYEGAFLVQVRSHTDRQGQPSFGSAKSDAGSSIISILEMSEEDFTTLLAETEETEAQAAKEYETLSKENQVSRASKEAEAKAGASEVKTAKVTLENSKEDSGSVQEELDAVNDYIAKLKPECESKAMSYQERKAAREADIAGLKQALSILEGKGM